MARGEVSVEVRMQGGERSGKGQRAAMTNKYNQE